MLKILICSEKLYAIKFHGKPVKIDPLKNSRILNNNEKNKKELMRFFGFKIMKIKKIEPKNILKKVGIKSKVSGIKNLKFSSNVKEKEIQ
tara:strand:+ start:508 stop:777 length:270 start_codon:yes stop_codon:yes gene_type:complete